MIDAAKRASAHYITAVVPYFGFARQDRKDKPRVAIGAKMIANLITAAGAHRFMTMDLHAAQITGFFDYPVDHLDASVIVRKRGGWGKSVSVRLYLDGRQIIKIRK